MNLYMVIERPCEETDCSLENVALFAQHPILPAQLSHLRLLTASHPGLAASVDLGLGRPATHGRLGQVEITSHLGDGSIPLLAQRHHLRVKRGVTDYRGWWRPIVGGIVAGSMMVATGTLVRIDALLNAGVSVGFISLSGLVFVPILRAPRQAAFVILAAFSALVGFSLMVYNANQQSIRQAVTPDRLLGRVQSGVFVLVAAAQVTGSLLGGAIGQLAGLRTAIAVGVVITLTSALPTVLSPLRGLRAVPAPVA